MNAIKKFITTESNQMDFVLPQLATTGDIPPNNNQWIHEIKYDGVRIICIKNNDNIQLITRKGTDWSSRFPSIVKELKNLKYKHIILDGEIALINNTNSFQELQNILRDKTVEPKLSYYIFDIIQLEDKNLEDLKLIDRKNILKSVINFKSDKLKNSPSIIGDGVTFFNSICSLGLEGIISKKIDSKYERKRTKTWLKFKCKFRQEFVIGGYTRPLGTREYFGSLLIGYFEDTKFIYCGKVGTGFNHSTLENLYNDLQKIKTDKSIFYKDPPRKEVKIATWVKPTMVIEVEFQGWTNDSMLRNPSFKGIREDKLAINVTKMS